MLSWQLLFCPVTVCGSPELSAAPDQHVVWRRDGIPAVHDGYQTGSRVDCLSATGACLLRRLPLRARQQGTPVAAVGTL